jgi:hypothetical protein
MLDSSPTNSFYLPAQVLRLCLLAHRLVFLQARGVVDLDPLVEDGLLLPFEKPLLDGRPAKAMIVWSWCVSPHAT